MRRLMVEVDKYDSGRFKRVTWYFKGKKHSGDNDPAETFYTEDGKVSVQRWFKHGKLHRTDGPAWIGFCSCGCVSHYFLDGKLISEERFKRQLPPIPEEELEEELSISELKKEVAAAFDQMGNTDAIVYALTTALFIFMMLYLTTYNSLEMTQIEWLKWLFTGKGAQYERI